MGEEIQEWQYLWGAKVKMPTDVPDDILKDGVNTVRAKLEVRTRLLRALSHLVYSGSSPRALSPSHYHNTLPCCDTQKYPDFEGEGGLKVVEEVKSEFDERWGPAWHCVMGKAFGSFVTHETQNFMYFYIGDKACMLYKAG